MSGSTGVLDSFLKFRGAAMLDEVARPTSHPAIALKWYD